MVFIIYDIKPQICFCLFFSYGSARGSSMLLYSQPAVHRPARIARDSILPGKCQGALVVGYGVRVVPRYISEIDGLQGLPYNKGGKRASADSKYDDGSDERLARASASQRHMPVLRTIATSTTLDRKGRRFKGSHWASVTVSQARSQCGPVSGFREIPVQGSGWLLRPAISARFRGVKLPSLLFIFFNIEIVYFISRYCCLK